MVIRTVRAAPVDRRKSYDTLGALVREKLGRNLQNPAEVDRGFRRKPITNSGHVDH